MISVYLLLDYVVLSIHHGRRLFELEVRSQ